MSPERLNENLKKLGWLAAAFISAAIVWLHVFFWQTAGGLWRDEVNLLNLAGSSSLEAMAHDSFPVLMPLLVKLWSAPGMGGSDASLRLLGMLIGLGIPAALWLAAWTARRSPPLISLTLLGLNSTLIFYGDSLRGHGAGSLLLLLAAAAMAWFLKKPSWQRAGILAAAATVSVQALFQNAVLFAAVGVGGWAVCWRRNDGRAAVKILAAGIFAAFSLLPYCGNIMALSASSDSLRGGFSPASIFIKFDSLLAFPFPPFDSLWEICTFAVIGLGVFTLLPKSRAASPTNQVIRDDLTLFAGVTLVAALAGFTGFLWFAALPTQPWYFLPLAALMAVCFDLGLPLFSLPKKIGTVGVGLMVFTALVAVPVARRDLNRRFTNVDILAAQLTKEAAPEDFIIVTPWFCGISFDRYFKGPTPWQTLPPLADHSTHRYDLVLEQMRNPDALRPIFQKIFTTLQSGRRVWVVGTMTLPRSGESPPEQLPMPQMKYFSASDTAYSSACSSQTAQFIADHSLQFASAHRATNRIINAYEDLSLVMAAGWKTNHP